MIVQIAASPMMSFILSSSSVLVTLAKIGMMLSTDAGPKML